LIPNFQRDFKWQVRQVSALLDSIRKGNPIGTITLWESAEKQLFTTLFENKQRLLKLRKNDSGVISWALESFHFSPPNTASTYWGVIDGRQRLTSLFTALGGVTFGHGKHRLNGIWVLDLKEDFFGEDNPILFYRIRDYDAKAKTISDFIREGLFPLWLYQSTSDFQTELLNPTHYEGSNLPSDYQLRAKNLTEFIKVTAAFSLPIVTLSKSITLDKVTEIFEVLNTAGTRVSVFDIIHSRLYGQMAKFSLRKRVHDINGNSLPTDFPLIRERFNIQGGDGAPLINQLATAQYLDQKNNLTPSGERKSAEQGGINSYKFSDLIVTPADHYAKLFDWNTKSESDRKGLPGLNSFESFLKDFTAVTQGCLGPKTTPYPILLCQYLALRTKLANASHCQVTLEQINECFRLFFWRASYHRHYDQGFLTSAVKHTDELWGLLETLAHFFSKNKKQWWGSLDSMLKAQGLSLPPKPKLNEFVATEDPKGAQRSLLSLLINSSCPKDLKTGNELAYGMDKEVEEHHIWPTRWMKDNAAVYAGAGSKTNKKDYTKTWVWRIPLSASSNKIWSSKKPFQALRLFRDKDKVSWADYQSFFDTLLMDQNCFDMLNDHLATQKTVNKFFGVREIILVDRLHNFLSADDLPSGTPNGWPSYLKSL
jgi:hypothetical protein